MDMTSNGPSQLMISTNSIVPKNVTVISWDGVSEINRLIGINWKGRNSFCEAIDTTRSDHNDPNYLPIHVNVTFGCANLYSQGWGGTGNFTILIYGFRLAAYIYGNVELTITCNNAETTKNDLLIPWIIGSFPPRPLYEPSLIDITVQHACAPWEAPLTHMYRQIQHDFRRMSIELMSIPNTSHPSAKFCQRLSSSR